MVTVLKDWTMVYLFGMPDGSQPETRWGRILIGTVVMDGTQRLEPGAYMCSDPIVHSPGNIAKSRTGQSFSLFGDGREVELPVTCLDELRSGVSLEKVIQNLKE